MLQQKNYRVVWLTAKMKFVSKVVLLFCCAIFLAIPIILANSAGTLLLKGFGIGLFLIAGGALHFFEKALPIEIQNSRQMRLVLSLAIIAVGGGAYLMAQ